MTQPVPDRGAPAPLLPALRLDARRLALLGGLALVTVALLLALGGGRATFAALRQLDGRLLLLAAAIHYTGFALRGHRWQALVAALGYRLGYRYTTGVLLAGWFVSALLPARAGDAFRIAALRLPPSSQPVVPAADSLGSIVMERTLDILALLLLSAGFGLGVLGLRLPGQVWAVYGGALLLLGGVALAALLMPSLLGRLRRRPAHPLWQRALDFSLEVIDSLRRLPRRPVWTIGMVGESLLIWLCDALLLWLAAASLGYGLPISVAGFTALTADIFAAVPLTPGGMGQVETAYGALLALLAEPAGAIPIAAVVLAARAVSYWSFLLISGGVTLAMGFGRLFHVPDRPAVQALTPIQADPSIQAASSVEAGRPPA